MTEFNRRDFLKIVGAASAGAALANVDAIWAVPDELVEEALRGPGIETFKKTVCQLCPAGCGINVRLIDGIPVHIDGSTIHPVNRGGICPHGAAGLDFLYNPDRIRQPMLRMGPVGNPQWKPISWDEAISKIATRLQSLRSRGAPEESAFFVRDERGLMHEMITRFMQSFGSRNVLAFGDEQYDVLPYQQLFGWKAVPGYDVENAQYLLAFGADFLEDGVSPVNGIHAYSQMRDREKGGRGRLVYADSRHSITAANSDRFLPINAGTHGALALGIAYVLIKERYCDETFVNSYVTGFESWTDADGTTHKGFKDLVLENYYPERVASITGVPARAVVEVARDFGRTRPAVAMTGSHGSGGTNGLINAHAVLSLNILIGNIEKPGGVRMSRETPFRELRPAPTDEVARRGLEKEKISDASGGDNRLSNDAALTFCDNVLSGRPYPVDTLFVYGVNPAFDHPYAKRIRQALERIPFVVSFASFNDETSQFADLILPQHTYLEGWMDSGATPSIAFAHAAVSQPVVEPFYDTRHTGDVLIQITQSLGDGVNRAFEHSDFLSTLQYRMHGVYASGEGTVVSGSFEESWVQFLKKRGWQNLVYESFDDFWKVLVEQGGWWDPITEALPPQQWLRTETGKIPLATHRSAGGRRSGDRSTAGLTDNTGLLPLFESPRYSGDENKFPYHLLTFGALSNRNGSGSYSPLLQEMFGYYRRLYWDSWVELNPHTARHHHIDEGEWVTITSDIGSITTRAMFNEAMEPSAVAIPFGMGHTSGGRYAEGVGVNPYEILAEVTDPHWGKPARAATRVKIEKAGRKVG
jgi:anaerobic selenocysteine-containing dehydrogenase